MPRAPGGGVIKPVQNLGLRLSKRVGILAYMRPTNLIPLCHCKGFERTQVVWFVSPKYQ
jgi:hypothetical protein